MSNIPTTSHSWETRRLVFTNQKKLYQKRLAVSLIAATIAGLLAYFMAYIGFSEEIADANQRLVYYTEEGFAEWRSNEVSPDLGFWQEIELAANGLMESLRLVFFENRDSIAGTSRAYGIILSSIAILITYRWHLHERLQLEGKYAQADDFVELKSHFWVFLWTRILYFFGSLFGGYVLLSVLFRVFSLGFPGLELDYGWATFAVGVLTAIITGIAVFVASAVNSRTILGLGIGAWVGGLFLSFILSAEKHGPPYWWCNAISDAGRVMPSAPVFTASFLSAVLAIWALWFDIDSLLERFIPKAMKELNATGAVNALERVTVAIREFSLRFIPQIVKDNFMVVIRLLYIGAMVGLLGVGFVRTNNLAITNNIIHTGGVVFSTLCVVGLTIVIPKRYFNPYYGLFSYAYMVVLLLLAIGYVGFSGAGCDGRFITLTTLELFTILFVVIWTYVTVDNLFHYGNAHWDELLAESKPEKKA